MAKNLISVRAMLLKIELLIIKRKKSFGEMLTESIKNASDSVFTISGFVIIFNIILSSVEYFGIFEKLSLIGMKSEICRMILYGLTEPTNGCIAVVETIKNPESLCMLLSAVVGWSGISVHLQVLGIIKNAGLENEKFDYSGYYLYDEQFLRLNGIRHYRLTLYDAILNIPVAERIVRRRIPKNTKKFILDSTANKPFICLTTDLFPMYRNVADEIGVKHQLCTFHLFQTTNHKLKIIFFSYSYSLYLFSHPYMRASLF